MSLLNQQTQYLALAHIKGKDQSFKLSGRCIHRHPSIELVNEYKGLNESLWQWNEDGFIADYRYISSFELKDGEIFNLANASRTDHDVNEYIHDHLKAKQFNQDKQKLSLIQVDDLLNVDSSYNTPRTFHRVWREMKSY